MHYAVKVTKLRKKAIMKSYRLTCIVYLIRSTSLYGGAKFNLKVILPALQKGSQVLLYILVRKYRVMVLTTNIRGHCA